MFSKNKNIVISFSEQNNATLFSLNNNIFRVLATEIQNIQIAEGDVCRGMTVPIYMIFPRLFTCPTLATPNFKVGKYVANYRNKQEKTEKTESKLFSQYCCLIYLIY